MISDIVEVVLTGAAMFVVARQCRKPSWLPGRLMAEMMNFSHGGMAAWGLSGVVVARDSTILEVGCGGGKTISALASLAPEGKVDGIDYSKASVAVAKRTNAQRIRDGRVEIHLGSVSKLPFDANTFDLAVAM